MKYIKKYEKRKAPKFKEGDIVVAIVSQYAGNTNWVLEGAKYVVIFVGNGPNFGYIQVQQLHPLTLEIDNTFSSRFYFLTINFISLEEYEFIQKQKKFNL